MAHATLEDELRTWSTERIFEDEDLDPDADTYEMCGICRCGFEDDADAVALKWCVPPNVTCSAPCR